MDPPTFSNFESLIQDGFTHLESWEWFGKHFLGSLLDVRHYSLHNYGIYWLAQILAEGHHQDERGNYDTLTSNYGPHATIAEGLFRHIFNNRSYHHLLYGPIAIPGGKMWVCFVHEPFRGALSILTMVPYFMSIIAKRDHKFETYQIPIQDCDQVRQVRGN